MGQGPQKPDHGGNFYMTPRRVTDSVAWRSLSLRARAVLQVFQVHHSGWNNGRIALTVRKISESIGDQNHGATSRSVAELIEKGFLECTSDADRAQSKSREYRLTFISTGEGKRSEPATHEYRDWRPAPGYQRKFGGAKSTTPKGRFDAEAATNQKFPVAFGATRSTESCGLASRCIVAVSEPHLDNHISGRSRPTLDQNISSQSRADSDARVCLEDLRSWTQATIETIGYGGARILARSSGVPEPAISRFRYGRSLPDHHRIALQEACGRLFPFRRWKESAD